MKKDYFKAFRRKFAKVFPIWTFAEYIILRGAMAFINLFPIKVSTFIMRRMGDILYFILPARRRVVFQNLEIAFGSSKPEAEKKIIARETFRHLAVCFMEFFRLPEFSKKTWEHITFKGMEHIDAILKRGKGQILVMSHLGQWEYLAFIPKFKKIQATILAKAVKNPYIYRWVMRLRDIAGARHSDKTFGLREVFMELKKNHGIGIVIDQWAGNEGIWIDFFGKPTSTTSLPARLAKKTDASILFAYCARISPGEYEISIEPPIYFDASDADWVRNTTIRLNRVLEDKIRLYPGQWPWTHRRWKDKRHFPSQKNPA